MVMQAHLRMRGAWPSRALGCAALALVACNVKDAPPTKDAEEAGKIEVEGTFSGFSCDQGGPFDGALRLEGKPSYVRISLRAPTRDVVTLGVECQGAADASACKKALEDANHQSAALAPLESPYRGYVHAVSQVQASVSRHDGLGDVVKLLAPIDTPAEAWIVAMAYGELSQPACADANVSASAQRAGAILLRSRYISRRCEGSNGLERSEIVLSVDQAGHVEILSRKVIEQPPLPCNTSAEQPGGR